MAQIKKFRFETCFDDVADEAPPAPQPEEPPPPPAPTFSEAEMEAAKAEAFAAGKAEGERAEAAAAAARTAEAIEQAVALIASADGRIAEACAGAERRSVEISLALMRALLPDLLRRRAIEEIEALLRESLTSLLDEPRLVIRVADEVLDLLNARIGALASRSGFSGKVILLAEDGMGPGDCRIEWADGGIERNSARTLREAQAVVARLLPPPPAPPADTPTV